MSLTVLQITDKISELRSKIAIHEGLVLHLKANYRSSDAGEAEMHFTRHDHAVVPETHIERFIEDTVDQIDELRAQLHHWENLTVSEKEDEQPRVQTRKGRKARGTGRRHQDSAASGEDGSEEAG